MSYESVIGFEVHIELATVSKMFCGCPADHFGKPPNTQTCPVCFGLPGALPVPNRKAIEWTVKLGLALDSQINLFSKFDRKNYFYPDLPKGYQISQYDIPFCHLGKLEIESGQIINIRRVHLEEDTGKLQHQIINGEKVTLVDFNRSGVPLVEIVTEPDFNNIDDGIQFLKEIQSIVRKIGISSADMEKGSMRLEANLSVRKAGDSSLPPYKVELKNINSFGFLKKAIEFDILRQTEILEKGGYPSQETRGYSEADGKTHLQRSKEEADDYRYFPDPDIPPINLSTDEIELIQKSLPPLPRAVRETLIKKGLTPRLAEIISRNDIYLRLLTEVEKQDPSLLTSSANVLVNRRFKSVPESALELIELIKYSTPQEIPDGALNDAIDKAISQNPAVVHDYKSGKTQVLGFLIGQIIKSLDQKVDPVLVSDRLQSKLAS